MSMGDHEVTRSATKEEMIARIARLEAIIDAALTTAYRAGMVPGDVARILERATEAVEDA